MRQEPRQISQAMLSPSKSPGRNENAIRHTLSIIGSECRPSSGNKPASNTTIQSWLSRIAPFVLVVVTLGAIGAAAQSQRSSSNAQGAPAPEPGNILPANHDAVFDATTAQRTALLNNIPPVTDDMLQHPPDGDWLTWRRAYNSLGYRVCVRTRVDASLILREKET